LLIWRVLEEKQAETIYSEKPEMKFWE
jgi:hypothetical protein